MSKYSVLILFSFLHLVELDAQSFKAVDGTKIAFTDEGGGTPVLLIHGFISSGSSWNGAILKSQLIEQGYRVIVPDLRGNGSSGRPQKEKAYANNAEVKDLMALMTHLKIKSYLAIGYSRGSIILAELLTMDNRIYKAVMGGMGIDFSDPMWRRRIMFEKAFGDEAELTSETQGAVNYARSINADLRVLSWLQKYQPSTPRSELKKIITPILVIAGNEDKDNGDPADLQKCLANAVLRIVKGDHNNTYKNAEFSTAVIEFLK